jgi:membrane protease YdiL (CAAX protease family)
MKKIWIYLGLAYALSWTALIPLIRIHAKEEVLILGICGPAFAAMLLSRSSVSQPDRLRRLLWFVAATLAGWVVLIFTSEWRGTAPHWPVAIKAWLIFPAMLPAWVISGAFSKDPGIRSLLRTLVHPPDWRWPVIALLSMPAFLLLPSALAHFFGMPLQWPTPQSSAGAYAAAGIVKFSYSLLFAGVLEEPGWRGFLLQRLQRRYSPLLASIFVWLPCALWHAPLDFGGWVASSLILYLEIRVIFLIPLTILTTWIYNRSGGAILAAALFHASFNTFPLILPLVPKMYALIFVWAGYVVVKDRMWRLISLPTSG